MRIGKATTLAPVFRLAGLHPKVPQSAAVSSSVLEAGALAQMLNGCPATLLWPGMLVAWCTSAF
jgi:hypothetical protein